MNPVETPVMSLCTIAIIFAAWMCWVDCRLSKIFQDQDYKNRTSKDEHFDRLFWSDVYKFVQASPVICLFLLWFI